MEQNTNTRRRTGGKKNAATEKSVAVVSHAEEHIVPFIDKQTAIESKHETERSLPGDLLVPCVSMVRSGVLVYTSKRQMGYKLKWQYYGDVQFIELAELMAMRNSDSQFFSENWIAIAEDFPEKERVLKVLRVDGMYSHSLRPNEMESLFMLTPDEIRRKVSGLSSSMRDSVYLLARNAMETGELDSIAKIRALESALERKLM